MYRCAQCVTTLSVNRTPTQTACTDAHSVSQHILNIMITFHHANTRGSRLHIFVPQNTPESFAARSVFTLRRFTAEWRINTNPISHRLYEPKVIEPEDLELGRIELDRNLGTDPYQTQSPKIWMNLEKLVLRCPTSSHRCIPIMTQRESIADSDRNTNLEELTNTFPGHDEEQWMKLTLTKTKTRECRR